MKFLLSILNAILFISLFSLSKQQQTFNRTCANFNVKGMPDFNLKRYIGKWYVYFMYDYLDEDNNNCITWDFLNYRDDISHCVETYQNINSKELTFIDSCFHFDKKGVGEYNYDWLHADDLPPEHDKIISTDYSTYAIQWSCDDQPFNRSQTFLTVTTRKRNPDPSTNETIKNILKENDIDISNVRFIVQDQKICRNDVANAHQPDQLCQNRETQVMS